MPLPIPVLTVAVTCLFAFAAADLAVAQDSPPSPRKKPGMMAKPGDIPTSLPVGTWALDPDACQLLPERTSAAYSQFGEGVFVRIGPEKIEFYESSCDLAPLAPAAEPDTYTLTTTCSGEGETWEVTRTVHIVDPITIDLTLEDATSRYTLCTP